MDETFLLNDYLPNAIIGRKGQETVKAVKDKLNQKEGTTFVGSLPLDPHIKLPLTIIAKGTTKCCQRKYGKKGKDLILHSKNGWSTTTVMKRY